MEKFKKYITIALIVVLVVCAIIIGKDFYETAGSESEIKKIDQIIYDVDSNEEWTFDKNKFYELKRQNDDFRGFIRFDSGLISLPILQGKDNEYYLHHTFYKKYYYLHGHPFMNYQSSIDDENIIIYGHNNRTGENAMFSPLNKLFNQKTYEENAYFKIYFEDSIRSYVITHVYKMTPEEYAEYDYERTFILENEWNEWISFPNSHNAIKPINGTLEYGNKFVTLQTCGNNNDDAVVILAREIKKEYY